MSLPLAGTVAGYALLGLLLLSLNLGTRWRWWVKAGVTLATTAFFAASYFAIHGLVGWPTTDPPPSRGQVLWTRIVEPDRHSGELGAIYLWIEALDANNVPSGRPRAHQIAYSEPVARKLQRIQEQLEEGEQIQISIEPTIRGKEGAARDEDPSEIEEGRVSNEELPAGTNVTVPFMEQHLTLHFDRLPPIVLPDKLPH